MNHWLKPKSNKPSEQSIEIAAQCWCDDRVSDRIMDTELATVFAEKLDELRKEYDEVLQATWKDIWKYNRELLKEIAQLKNDKEMAWGIIANAYGGDWLKSPDSWRLAAIRWRDENLDRKEE